MLKRLRATNAGMLVMASPFLLLLLLAVFVIPLWLFPYPAYGSQLDFHLKQRQIWSPQVASRSYSHIELRDDELLFSGGGGAIVGNGGDPLRQRFWEGKKIAADLVAKTSLKGLRNRIELSESLWEWLETRQEALAKDILLSPHQWHSEPAGSCGLTQLQAQATLQFSYPSCRSLSLSIKDILKILIHESVHHFGISDDERSVPDLIAGVFSLALEQNFVHWESLDTQATPREMGAGAYADGHVLIYGGLDEHNQMLPGIQVLKLQDQAGAEKHHTQAPLWKSLFPEISGALASSVLPLGGGTFILWGGLTQESPSDPLQERCSGYLVSLSTLEWSPLVPPKALACQGFAKGGTLRTHTAVWTGEELLVWGQANAAGLAGVRWNRSSNTWSQISAKAPAPKVYGAHSAVWSGKEMIVWGGLDANSRPTRNGALYDPKTNQWRQLEVRGAPQQSANHEAIWTGTHMVTFGGRSAEAEAVGQFGVYNPLLNTWETIDLEMASAREGHRLSWTGWEVVVTGGQARRTSTIFAAPIFFQPQTKEIRMVSAQGGPGPMKHHLALWLDYRLMLVSGRKDVGTLHPRGYFLQP